MVVNEAGGALSTPTRADLLIPAASACSSAIAEFSESGAFRRGPILIAAEKTSRKSAESRFGAFSAATSYAKPAAQARISINSSRIVNGEGLDGGERRI